MCSTKVPHNRKVLNTRSNGNAAAYFDICSRCNSNSKRLYESVHLPELAVNRVLCLSRCRKATLQHSPDVPSKIHAPAKCQRPFITLVFLLACQFHFPSAVS